LIILTYQKKKIKKKKMKKNFCFLSLFISIDLKKYLKNI
jgi:hypothetical protein